MKTAVVIMSDPKSGSEEALGRVFNGLAVASECKEKGDEVTVVFNGAGTRWPEELMKLAHPAHKLYEDVRDVISGASCACAEVFEATDGVRSCGVPIVKDNPLVNTPGLLSLRRYISEGWRVLIF
jgi:hypothetical protein